MLKLFAVMLGGRALGCNIELHDVVFVVGNSLEELYPQLVNKWFGGIPKSLHVDASVELKYVDGHEILIQSKSEQLELEKENAKKLYFANFGGYKEGFFGEFHEINFYVASSRVEALGKAKNDLCVGLHQQHSDDHLIVDDLIEVGEIGPYSLHFIPTEKECLLQVEAHYRKLNLPHIIEKAALLNRCELIDG